MKARWFIVGAIICFVVGLALPYVMISMDAGNVEGWSSIWWLIVSPSIYSYYTYLLWIAAAILFVIAIIVYVHRKKKRRK